MSMLRTLRKKLLANNLISTNEDIVIYRIGKGSKVDEVQSF